MPDDTLGLAASGQEPAPASAPKRERLRKNSLKIDREKIAQRVIDFYIEDDQNRSEELNARLQRHAKFRMWTEGKDWPWEDASDCALPDLMTHSLKVQDTLNNAVMSTRPAISAKAMQKSDAGKEDNVNQLLDVQFFEENRGEVVVGELVDAFVNDGVITVFVPWIKEEREGHEIHTLDPIPDADTPEKYFARQLAGIYPKNIYRKKDTDGWSWEVMQDPKTSFEVEFYTVGKKIEMDAQKMRAVFDGPRPMVKDWEDVLHPVRAANLQIPSPSNPNGAAHVILVDYPTIDEIKRLQKSGFYDLLTLEDVAKLDMQRMDSTTGQSLKVQLDTMQGVQENLSKNDGAGEAQSPDHKPLTRLMCFDLFDSDGDGVNEDMIWWVLKEPKLLMRARELTQVYPCNPPRRPFAEGSFLPVKGRRTGISLLEMMEGLHDVIKQFLDQTIDAATIRNVPFFFYRATSNLKPETIRLWPGEGYPLADPKNDVNFPSFAQDGSAAGFNLISMLSQYEEKLTNIGDLQLGRVPQGKSSALRTVRGMQSVLGQGDARPERILRRFFMCYTDIYTLMHELNQAFLPREKQIRIYGLTKPNEDPYKMIDPAQIRGRFQFEFSANAMNTSKEAMQDSLSKLMGVLLQPIMVQMQIVKPDNVYQLARDSAKALGMGSSADKYVTAPTPESNLPKMFAEEVISMIMAGNLPEARPAEPTMEHLKALMDFAGGDDFGLLTSAQAVAFKAYLAQLRQRIQAEMQQQQMVQAAGQTQVGPQGVPGPQGSAPINTAQAPVQNNELMDESLPGAGGGGNPMTLQ